MPPKKRKTLVISHENKGVGRLYLEEHWSFVDEQLNSDFILTHGHIWYHLITHQFHVGSLTSLILPLHTNDLSREYKQLVNLNVRKLSVELQKLRLHLKLEEKMNEFKKMCENLFIYPPELTPSVPTPSNSSLVAPSSDTESTPVKKLKEPISTLLSTPSKTRHQNQVIMTRKARRCVFKKDCELKTWRHKYWMLSKSSQLTALRNNQYRLKRRDRKISVLDKTLLLTRKRLYYHMRMAKEAKTKNRVSENVLSACLAESENTTLKLEEELIELKTVRE